jgi:hypothetical protein
MYFTKLLTDQSFTSTISEPVSRGKYILHVVPGVALRVCQPLSHEIFSDARYASQTRRKMRALRASTGLAFEAAL